MVAPLVAAVISLSVCTRASFGAHKTQAHLPLQPALPPLPDGALPSASQVVKGDGVVYTDVVSTAGAKHMTLDAARLSRDPAVNSNKFHEWGINHPAPEGHGDFACPIGFSYKASSKTCIMVNHAAPVEECPYGSYRDRTSKRCIRTDSIAPDRTCPSGFSYFMRGCIRRSSVQPVMSCPAGYSKMGAQCMSHSYVPAMVSCAEGFVLSPADLTTVDDITHHYGHLELNVCIGGHENRAPSDWRCDVGHLRWVAVGTQLYYPEPPADIAAEGVCLHPLAEDLAIHDGGPIWFQPVEDGGDWKRKSGRKQKMQQAFEAMQPCGGTLVAAFETHRLWCVLPALAQCTNEEVYVSEIDRCSKISTASFVATCPFGLGEHDTNFQCASLNTQEPVVTCPEGFTHTRGSKHKHDITTNVCELIEYADYQVSCPVGYERERARNTVHACVNQKPVEGIFVCPAGFLETDGEDPSETLTCIKTTEIAPSITTYGEITGPDTTACIRSENGGLSCGVERKYHAPVTEDQERFGLRYQEKYDRRNSRKPKH